MSNNAVVDLFSGAGGMSLGFSEAGFDIALGIDNNSAAIESFNKNHINSSFMLKDVTKVTTDEITQKIGDKTVDVLIGGPPCQGLSLSGPRKFHDPRNKLFLSFVKITQNIKPKAFVLENVPGLVGLFKGEIKDAIMKEFSNAGYKVSYKVIFAADYGVPQLRKRVFFVGLKDADITFNFPSPKYFENNYITCEEALSDLPPLIDELGEEKQKYISQPQNEYQKLMREKSKYVYNHIAVAHAERIKEIINLVPEGGNYKDLPLKYRNTRNFHIAWTRFHSKKPAPTVDTGHRHHFHYKYNRVPTVREHARLQSFPDTFVFCGNKSQQNAQVGNAVPPLMAKSIAEELKKCL